VTAEQLHICLSRLRPHVDESSIAITGSVAIDLHCSKIAGARRARVPGDLDLVANSLEAVASSITRMFLVSHFHTPQPGYAKFLIQLVDPVSRVRVDIFSDRQECVSRAIPFVVDESPLLVVDPLGLFEHKLATLAHASPERRVDRKHVDDALALGAMCRRDVPTISSDCLGHDEYSQDVVAVCPRCEVSKSSQFPLARKEEILALLGYV